MRSGGSSSRRPRSRRGYTALLPLAIRAIMTVSCKGVVSTKPWPMAEIRVSPICQGWPVFSSFQASVGMLPASSPARSRPEGAPSPSLRAMAVMRSMPMRRATS